MCDTYGQYLTMKEEIDASMEEVIKSTQFIKSGKVLEFEKELSSYLQTNVTGTRLHFQQRNTKESRYNRAYRVQFIFPVEKPGCFWRWGSGFYR
jgi:hypothetical protein